MDPVAALLKVSAPDALPSGYSENALYLRRWLLDLRLRLDALPLERQRLLERKIYEFHTDGKINSRKSTSGTLARAVAG